MFLWWSGSGVGGCSCGGQVAGWEVVLVVVRYRGWGGGGDWLTWGVGGSCDGQYRGWGGVPVMARYGGGGGRGAGGGL